MTTKELMLGDYVTFSDVQNDSDCPKLKVVIINEQDVCVSIDGDPVVDDVDPKELVGIPLTPEILEKNGFVYKDALHNTSRGVWVYNAGNCNNIYVQFTDKVAIEIHNEINKKDNKGRADLVTFCRDWCDALFVHELQRAIRLCEIEKEIEL